MNTTPKGAIDHEGAEPRLFHTKKQVLSHLLGAAGGIVITGPIMSWLISQHLIYRFNFSEEITRCCRLTDMCLIAFGFDIEQKSDKCSIDGIKNKDSAVFILDAIDAAHVGVLFNAETEGNETHISQPTTVFFSEKLK